MAFMYATLRSGGPGQAFSKGTRVCHRRLNDVVILPFLTGCIRRIHAAIFSFCAGVMPPTLCRAVGLSSQARTTMSSWLRSGVLAWR